MKIRNLILTVSGVSLLLLGATACTTVNTVERKEPTAEVQVVDDKRITTDYSLNRKMRVERVIEGQVGGMMRVQVDVRNLTNSDYNVNYKFEWYDNEGFKVENVSSGWEPLHIYGKEPRSIISVANSARCKDFRLKFIEAQN